MNKLIVLPGNSKKNQVWGEEIVRHFGNQFDEVYMQYYDHWETDSKEMNFESELSKLKQAAENTDTKYLVFAKSLGSLLSLISINNGSLNPKNCVFFGLPLDLANDGLFKDDWSALKNFSVPSLAFHNIDDPTAGFEFTKNKLSEFPQSPIKFIETPGDTHEYLDFDLYDSEIRDLLKF